MFDTFLSWNHHWYTCTFPQDTSPTLFQFDYEMTWVHTELCCHTHTASTQYCHTIASSVSESLFCYCKLTIKLSHELHSVHCEDCTLHLIRSRMNHENVCMYMIHVWLVLAVGTQSRVLSSLSTTVHAYIVYITRMHTHTNTHPCQMAKMALRTATPAKARSLSYC